MAENDSEEIELSDVDFEDEEEEMECELVSEPEQQSNNKLNDKSPNFLKPPGTGRSIPEAIPDADIAAESGSEETVPDTDFEDEDELEPEEVVYPDKSPKPKHDIQFKEPKGQEAEPTKTSEDKRTVTPETEGSPEPETGRNRMTKNMNLN
uniref:Uncharacterized protein n=1 Tax=Setaria digitata TaxID=48799 RepID=A0A915PDY9_9BILA